ncbi:probable glutathione S-transferase GSTU6 [Oryza brachyantha]|uniref:Glutathione S-transferase n=1 Tax=Oryza brachyantha TaxID=4533 RepID=J3N4B6_ORYBR|nr:probable glutathione S-transferase GSTU6 [Oryza brachyantha]
MAGKDDDVKVLGVVVSPFAIRVRIALGIKSVSYEYVEEDLFNKSELLLSSNPVHKKIPVLIHNGRPVCESSVIVQYIDEVWAAAAPSILPADPHDRAVARFWAAYVDDKMFPGMFGVLMAATEEERAAKANEALAAMAQLEKAFAECAGGGKAFFGGDSIGYVDLALGSNLHWFEALRRMFGVALLDAGKTPLLAAWAKRFVEAEAAKGVVPDAGETVEFAKKLQARTAA